jgi:hypothetical protein
MPKIYYWRDVIGDNEQFEPYLSDINRLIAGQYRALSLEKLQRGALPSIFSIRVGKEKSTRILFTQYKSSICLLDVVLNHDYDKSRFLKHPAILKAFLKKMGDDLPAIDPIPSEPSIEFAEHLHLDGIEASSTDLIAMTPLSKYQDHLIEFNIDQNQTLEKPLPHILLGPAGSGKTCVALSMLSKHTLKHYKPGSAPAIYITQSAALVKEMQHDWNDTTPVELQGAVLFKTYDDVLKSQLDPKTILVKESHFETWYKDKYKKKSASASDDGQLDTKSLWKELRLRSGYSKEDYLGLGERQSAFDPQGRQFICACYDAYMGYLKTCNLVSPALHDLSPGAFSLVVVDEAQDMSYGQLNQLRRFAPKFQIAFLLGEHQILFDGKSRFNYLRQLFFGNKTDVSVSRLRLNYRSSPAVLNVANGIINLKYHATGGVVDKEESAVMISANRENTGHGRAEWLLPDSKEMEFYRGFASTNPDVAVITWPAYMSEANERFNTPLVLTPSESKGLEFHTVIFWRPFDNADCYQACEKLSEQPVSETKPGRHRAKKGQGFESFLPYFNELITAVTRAEEQVVIIQGKQHKSRFLIDALKAIMIPEKPSADIKCEALPAAAAQAPVFQPPAPVKAPQYSWSKRVISLIKTDNLQLARSIFVEKVDSGQDAFEVFYAKHARSYAPALPAEIASSKKTMLKKQSKVGVSSVIGVADEESQAFKTNRYVHELLADPKLSSAGKLHQFKELLLQDLRCMQDPFATEWLKKELNASLGKGIEKTCLFDLASDERYQKILSHIVINRPDLIAEISPKAWGAFIKDGICKHTSPMYCLANTTLGRRTLEVLITKYPKIVAAIDPTAWSRSLTVGPNENTSPLYWVVASPQGLKVLRALIENCPDVIRNIPSEAWYQRRTKAAMSDANLSVLYVLTTNIQGLKFLNELFIKYPDIAKNIPAHAWTTFTSLNGIENRASPLLGVLINGSLIGLVDTIVKLEPSGFDDISANDWLTLLTSRLPAKGKEFFLSALVDGKCRQKAVASLMGRYSNFAAIWDMSFQKILAGSKAAEAGFFSTKAGASREASVAAVADESLPSAP